MGRRTVLLAAAVVVAVVATAVAISAGVGDADPPRGGAPPQATAEVLHTTLVDSVDVDGELGFGRAVPLRYQPPLPAPPPADQPTPDPPPPDQPATGQPTPDRAGPDRAGAGGAAPPGDDQGLVTWLPAVESTVGRGRPLFRVDNRPVLLLYGPLPLYRSLAVGVRGPDVRQFERNLRALGYTGFSVDESYGAATAAAVRRWQRSAGLPDSGAVAPGRVHYAGGAIRVAGHSLRVGDGATGEILTYTSTRRVVTAELAANRRRYVRPGVAVTVTLPDGRTVAGTVERVGAGVEPAGAAPGQAPAPGQDQPVEVVVAVAHQAALDEAVDAVRVRFVLDQRADVLAVPVVALVALVEGGYGVQAAEGASTRYVAVETGMFAGNLVEIKAGAVRAGMRVVVPG